jgi:hypothetical protein
MFKIGRMVKMVSDEVGCFSDEVMIESFVGKQNQSQLGKRSPVSVVETICMFLFIKFKRIYSQQVKKIYLLPRLLQIRNESTPSKTFKKEFNSFKENLRCKHKIYKERPEDYRRAYQILHPN